MPEVRTTSSTGGQKGVKLARFDLIPAGPLRELAEHYGRGARKYANHQWRQGYEWSKSIGALGRHFNDFMAGFDYDVCSNDPDGCSFVDANGEDFVPEQPDTCFNHTGSHHMAAVAWHSFLLLEFKDTHPNHDDRYRLPVEEDVDVRVVVDENSETGTTSDIPSGLGDLTEPRYWWPEESARNATPTVIREEDGWRDIGYVDETHRWGPNDLKPIQDAINRSIRDLAMVTHCPPIFKPEEDSAFVIDWRDPTPRTPRTLADAAEALTRFATDTAGETEDLAPQWVRDYDAEHDRWDHNRFAVRRNPLYDDSWLRDALLASEGTVPKLFDGYVRPTTEKLGDTVEIQINVEDQYGPDLLRKHKPITDDLNGFHNRG